MQLLVISSSGDSLPLCLQMQEEGVDITVYIHNPDFQSNYEGMLKQRLSSVTDLCKWISDANPADTVVLFDMTRTMKEDCEEDIEFLKVRRVTPKTCRSTNLFGPTAEHLAEEGFKVIGNCPWGENAEMDRKRGKTIAGQLGLDLPHHVVATTLGGAIQTMKGRFNDVRAVLKPFGNHHLDCTYIEHYTGELLEKLNSPWAERLQWPAVIEQYIDGVTVDEEIWFDGDKFVQGTLNSTIERKRFGNDDTGPNVGSSLNLVWMKSNALVNWLKLEHNLHRAQYIGPINATMQLSSIDGKPYFLEWACRFGYDAIFGLARLMKPSFGQFLLDGFQGGFLDDQYAATIRVSIPPYPYEEASLRKLYAEGTPVSTHATVGPRDVRLMDVRQGKTNLECAGADGIAYVAVGTGEEPKAAFQSASRWIKRVRVASDIQHRTDWECITTDFRNSILPKQRAQS